jgi:hypothetical protein
VEVLERAALRETPAMLVYQEITGLTDLGATAALAAMAAVQATPEIRVTQEPRVAAVAVAVAERSS